MQIDFIWGIEISDFELSEAIISFADAKGGLEKLTYRYLDEMFIIGEYVEVLDDYLGDEDVAIFPVISDHKKPTLDFSELPAELRPKSVNPRLFCALWKD
jgi:hypothetical protein